MKYRSILIATLFALLVGCTSQQPAPSEPSSSSQPVSSSEASTMDVSSQAVSMEGASSEQEPKGTLEEKERIVVADAAVYRGILQDLSVDEQGRTAWILEKVEGSDYQYPRLQAVITDSTRFNSDNSKIGNGSYLEVYYSGEPDEYGLIEAIAINELLSPDLTIYNGVLTQIEQDKENKGYGSLYLKGLTEEDMGYTFHYSPETQFYMELSSLKEGDLLHVVHSPASTRSLPPQSAAFEVHYASLTEDSSTKEGQS
ncbi:MAG: hypothetical protein HFG20_02695 [Anaerotruncus sp.]|nr:hypothetical protein [Anaerotruncus sp.]